MQQLVQAKCRKVSAVLTCAHQIGRRVAL